VVCGAIIFNFSSYVVFVASYSERLVIFEVVADCAP
jgi:hypothetical protein